MLDRRQFLGVVGAGAFWPTAGRRDSPISEWGSPVFDLHFHMRGATAANVTHLDGAGITSANLLTQAAAGDQVRTLHRLLFGSDCGCTDGHGGGVSQGHNPAAGRLAGKCVARETLTGLKRSTSAEIFRKITWDNAHALLKIPA